MNRIALFLAVGFLLCLQVAVAQNQNSDSLYRQPLKTVLAEIESRFKVKVKYSENQVKDRWVNYALWRFRSGVDETLSNVLAPLDMKVNKEKDGVYKLKEYEYYRWQVQEGQNTLDHLATLNSDKAGWEQRKALIKPCLYEAQQLSVLPPKPDRKSVV